MKYVLGNPTWKSINIIAQQDKRIGPSLASILNPSISATFLRDYRQVELTCKLNVNYIFPQDPNQTRVEILYLYHYAKQLNYVVAEYQFKF